MICIFEEIVSKTSKESQSTRSPSKMPNGRARQRNTRHANRQRQTNSVRAVPVESNEPPIIVQATEAIPDQSQRIRELEQQLALKTELADNQRIHIEGMMDTCKKSEQEIEDLHGVIDQYSLRLDKANDGTLCAFQEEELKMLTRDMDKLEKDNMILLRDAQKAVEEGYSFEVKKAMALGKCMSNPKFEEGSIISYEGRWFVRISKKNVDRLSAAHEHNEYRVNTAEGLAAFNSS